MKENEFNNFINPPIEARPRIRYWLPEGMVNKIGIIRDIKDFKQRGFGGIEVVPCQASIEDEKYAWNGQLWYENLECILEEADKQEMKVDIAIGPQWPIAMPTITNADHEASLYELTYGFRIIHNAGELDYNLPNKRVSHEEGTSKLLTVMAYQLVDENILDIHTYQDLTPYVKDNKINYNLNEMNFPIIIFAFWEQPSTHKVFDKYYVIDHLSALGAKQCELYWKENLYPLIIKHPNVCESIFCDSLEYNVSMEWTRGLEKIFMDKKGYDLLPYLPIISINRTYPKCDTPNFQINDSIMKESINNDFYDVINECHIKNHLQPLENLARNMGMNLRYQVGYNKPYNIESCAMNVSIPENESLNRVSINNLMSMNGAVHLMNKKIYSYECNAEFMNAYGQTYEDLLWWIKRSYLAGINRQVIHGAAYNGGYNSTSSNREEYYQWPGYENFGKYVSNYWNRTLSIEHSRHHMDYISRINSVLQKQHKVDLAIYRHDYLNDGKGADGEYIIHDNGILMNNGYSYDIVSAKLLEQEGLSVENNILEKNGPGYKALIFNNISEITTKLFSNILKFARDGLPIYFIGQFPSRVKFASEYDLQKDLQKFLDSLKKCQNVKCVKNYEMLLQVLVNDCILPDACYLNEVEIGNVHCKEDQIDYYYFYNYNSVNCTNNDKIEFNKESYFPFINKELCFKDKILNVQFKHTTIPILLDAQTGEIRKINYKKNEYGIEISLKLLADEAIILAFLPQDVYELLEKDMCDLIEIADNTTKSDFKWTIDLYKLLNKGPLFSDVEYYYYKHFEHINELTWWNEMNTSLNNFVGYGVYRTQFEMNKEENVNYLLELCEISDTFEIDINGHLFTQISQFAQTMDITKFLNNGENKISIKVYSNLANLLIDDANKHYGINGKIKIRRTE